MEKFHQLLQLNCTEVEKENAIQIAFSEEFLQIIPIEDMRSLLQGCLTYQTYSPGLHELEKKASRDIIAKLQLYRTTEFNNLLPQLVTQLFSIEERQPLDVLITIEELLNVECLENVVSNCFSRNVTSILQGLHQRLNLAVLVKIGVITQTHPKCLPPVQENLFFCVEIINQIASLTIPSSNRIMFMEDVNLVSKTVQKLWFTSSTDVVLQCLSVIYTLIVCSSDKNLPSPSLAAFLNIVSSIQQIETVLDKLLLLPELSSDVHVTKLSSVLCDWLLQWPKAPKVANWVISLFKMLTLDNRSSIVAGVISKKAPKLMEQSIIPVMRSTTAPVLLYILYTLRDSPPDELEVIVYPAVKLFRLLKIQKDAATQQFLANMAEAFYILIRKLLKTGTVYKILHSVISDYPIPSEERILTSLSSVPDLFSHQQINDFEAISHNSNWLSRRTQTGKIGLINLGNTCYINSILQALAMNQDFARAVLESVPTCHQLMLVKLQQVMSFLFYSFRAAYSPAVFVRTSRPPWFEAGRQQDCSEFLRFLLDSLYEQEKADRAVLQCDHRWTVVGVKGGEESHIESNDVEINSENTDTSEDQSTVLQRWMTEEDLSSQTPSNNQVTIITKDASAESLSNIHSESTDSGIQSLGSDGTCEYDKKLSLIHKIFGGKMTTTYKCLTCFTESHHQNFFTDIHLAFPDLVSDDKLNLETLLQYYLAAEKLQGDNRYHCDNCAGLKEAERTIRVTESPQHLLLTLLRFRFDRLLQRRGKITTQVEYPQQLELPINGKVELYILYAVVIHSGVSLDGGHYYTLARSSHIDAKDVTNGTWYMFNDSQVSYTDFQSLMELSKKYPMDTPYLLWYRRAIDTVSININDGPITLAADLKQSVELDNFKFSREKQMHIRRHLPKKDDDDDDHSGRFHDNTGSRFVF